MGRNGCVRRVVSKSLFLSDRPKDDKFYRSLWFRLIAVNPQRLRNWLQGIFIISLGIFKGSTINGKKQEGQ
jgi:hypothetical protein